MRKFSPKVKMLVLALVLVSIHHFEATRFKSRAGLVSSGIDSASLKKCITRDSWKEGVCVELTQCDEATKTLVSLSPLEQRRFLISRVCGLVEATIFYCCIKTAPSHQQPSVGSVPIQTTESDLNKICGIAMHNGIKLQIVGGTEASLKAWPWMAVIFIGPSRSFVNCGGALISKQYVLTAAHCLFDKSTGQKYKISEYTIRLGEFDIQDENDGATTMDLSAAKLIWHEDFKWLTLENDIALIKLNRNVPFTDSIRPICLPSSPPMSNDFYEGKHPYVAGWGRLKFDGRSSSKLQQVMLTVKSNSECQTDYRGITMTSTRIKATIAESQLCASDREGIKGTCYGDSGGPLMLANSDNRWFTIGIVSFGVNCTKLGFPGVYTRTTSYIDWIKENASIQ